MGRKEKLKIKYKLKERQSRPKEEIKTVIKDENDFVRVDPQFLVNI